MSTNVGRFVAKIAGRKAAYEFNNNNNNNNNAPAGDADKWTPAAGAMAELSFDAGGTGLTPPSSRIAVPSDRILFDSTLLSDDSLAAHFEHALTPIPDGLVLRSLMLRDMDKGYLELLAQLTDVGKVDQAAFHKRFDVMAQPPLAYYIIVVEDMSRNKMVASISMVLEWKFIHGAGFRGRIEDVVVCDSMRGKGLGRILCERATALGRKLGCYKMSLECKDHLLAFYNRFGFAKDEGNNFMGVRFDKLKAPNM